MHQLDHLVIAAPDLADAKTAFADATGCMPVDGGAHNGLGTRNALVSFGTSTIATQAKKRALTNCFGHID